MRRVPTPALIGVLLGALLFPGVGWAQGYSFDSAVGGLAAASDTDRQSAIDRLTGIGVLALPSVLAALDHTNPTVRQGARVAAERITYAAAGTRDEAVAAAYLLRAFKGSANRPWVRDLTMQLLSLVAGKDEVPVLADSLADRWLGEAARYVLIRVGGRAAADAVDEALGQALQSGDEAQAVALVQALSQIGVATPNVVRALAGAEPLALAALAALPKASDPALADDILALTESSDPDVAAAARRALLELASRLLDADQAGAAADVYACALDRAVTVQDRCWALSGLARSGADVEGLLWEAMASGEPSLVGVAMRELIAFDPDPVLIADRISTAFSPEREGLIWMLGEIGGREAVAALRDLVGHPDPATRRVVYAALAKNPDARAAVRIVDSLASHDPGLRAEGLSVVNRTPGAAVSRAIERNLKSPTTPADVRLALVAALSHRKASEAVDPLVWAARSDDADLRKAALNSLAALRDPLVVAPLLPLASTLPADEQPLAVAAIAAVPKAQAEAILLSVLDTGSEGEATVALQVLAAYRDPALRGTFAVAARSRNERVAAAALSGLAEVPAPGVVALLKGYSRDARRPVRTAAKSGLLTVAEDRDPQDEVALAVYHGVLTDPESDRGMVQRALRGIARVGSVESLALVEPMLDDPGELATEVAAAMLSIANGVATSDRGRAIEIYERILSIAQDRATLTAAAAALRSHGVEVDLAGPGGFITGWWVTPPIADRATMEAGDPLEVTDHIDPLQPFRYKDKEYKWAFHRVDDPLGMLNLEEASARQDNVGAYVLATVISDTERDVVLKVGSDDGVAVYVNGVEVHRNFLDRAWAVDQDTVPARLRQGENQILCKVLQGGAQWAVSVRITENDRPLVLPQLAPTDVAASRGIIAAWWLTDRVGSQEALREGDVVDTAKPVDVNRPVEAEGRLVSWRYVLVDDLATGYLNLRRALGPQEYLGIYGYAEFVPSKPGKAILAVGSDDDVYVWLNGELVHRNNAARAAIPGDDRVEVQLRDGINTLLVKILQGNGEWGMVAQVLDANGAPLPITLRSLAK